MIVLSGLGSVSTLVSPTDLVTGLPEGVAPPPPVVIPPPASAIPGWVPYFVVGAIAVVWFMRS